MISEIKNEQEFVEMIYHSSLPFPLVSLKPVDENLMRKGKVISSARLQPITLKQMPEKNFNKNEIYLYIQAVFQIYLVL